MDTRHVERIENIASFAAAAVLAVAVASVVGRLFVSTVAASAGAVAAFASAWYLLRSIGPSEAELSLAQFVPAELALEESDELLLTERDQFVPKLPPADELLLDDVLARLGAESRVVRLFDASAMPTPGQLRTRIDRHLNQTQSNAGSADASQALHAALAELRSSLK